MWHQEEVFFRLDSSYSRVRECDLAHLQQQPHPHKGTTYGKPIWTDWLYCPTAGSWMVTILPLHFLYPKTVILYVSQFSSEYFKESGY